MISPITIATHGLLNSPLSVSAVRGHLIIETEPEPEKPGGGNSKNGLHDPREYTVTPGKLKDLKGQLGREDEEILSVIVAVMDVIQ